MSSHKCTYTGMKEFYNCQHYSTYLNGLNEFLSCQQGIRWHKSSHQLALSPD